jgi:hypothetical protein
MLSKGSGARIQELERPSPESFRGWVNMCPFLLSPVRDRRGEFKTRRMPLSSRAGLDLFSIMKPNVETLRYYRRLA